MQLDDIDYIQKIIMLIQGRLYEQGIEHGIFRITEDGLVVYRQLKAEGFNPPKEHIQ